ncbi:MAG TPA: cob(I)yrinic acid a,c-diamide adenosyltransferase [Puia sp.]|nr:cob(I)yrinic acid a,c-diamide adenosyltransferase [Puia sp.]
MSTKIYTKTGDKGTTGLIGGTKVPKSHPRIDAYGTIDELNSFVGLLNDHLNAAGCTTPVLKEIQDRLFTIGSSLACDPAKEPRLKIPDLKAEDITLLETEIDRMTTELPPMRSFILPGGHVAVSTAHITRCVCRRAERACVRLQEEQLFVEPLVLSYLNRLSDYLFVLARYTGHCLFIPDVPWQPR